MADEKLNIYCIDIGNTRTHCALVSAPAAKARRRLSESDFELSNCAEFDSAEFAKAFSSASPALECGADAVAWCSVVPKYAAELSDCLRARAVASMQLTWENSPLRLDMKAPAQVGQDRIAAALGAGLIFDPPYITVDMGTAVTIDLVDASGAYAGGAIAPGMHAFAQYLSERAAQLPKINPAMADYSLNIGKDTVEAMYVGCAKGFCRLADGIISDIEGEFFGGQSAAGKTVFTGGSVGLLPKKWLAGRRIELNLTQLGLAYAYILNISKTEYDKR